MESGIRHERFYRYRDYGACEFSMCSEIDAEVEPDLPRGWLQRNHAITRLFADFFSAEKDYYNKTKIFPIMHPIVIKNT